MVEGSCLRLFGLLLTSSGPSLAVMGFRHRCQILGILDLLLTCSVNLVFRTLMKA